MAIESSSVRHWGGVSRVGCCRARALVLIAATGVAAAQGGHAGYGPGARVLLDGHNAYPERGQWADRLARVLSTGTPVAIEQDLFWVRQPDGRFASVVAHDSDAVAGAPTLEAHFFARLAPLMDRAVAEGRRETWPLVVLNLDFKTNERQHHAFVAALLRRYARWCTWAPRTATPGLPAPLTVGPMLVLTGADTTQRVDFHDALAVGDTLRLFGALPLPDVTGDTREARADTAVARSAAAWITARAGNWYRWVNFPWNVVEAGGQARAGDWTAPDDARLRALVARAHGQGYWIRFYTLDGFTEADNRGWAASYNFGSLQAAQRRWRAAVRAGVDYVATDQYEAFAIDRRRTGPHPGPGARPPG